MKADIQAADVTSKNTITEFKPTDELTLAEVSINSQTKALGIGYEVGYSVGPVTIPGSCKGIDGIHKIVAGEIIQHYTYPSEEIEITDSENGDYAYTLDPAKLKVASSWKHAPSIFQGAAKKKDGDKNNYDINLTSASTTCIDSKLAPAKMAETSVKTLIPGDKLDALASSATVAYEQLQRKIDATLTDGALAASEAACVEPLEDDLRQRLEDAMRQAIRTAHPDASDVADKVKINILPNPVAAETRQEKPKPLDGKKLSTKVNNSVSTSVTMVDIMTGEDSVDVPAGAKPSSGDALDVIDKFSCKRGDK
ncbi:hypothetical protein CR983_01215 [Candidatus Saccharibacteria bacterium]|nr:MAG: hypothetical protein CR983_01215 [Candidatus Saccharibacteria bacterium]